MTRLTNITDVARTPRPLGAPPPGVLAGLERPAAPARALGRAVVDTFSQGPLAARAPVSDSAFGEQTPTGAPAAQSAFEAKGLLGFKFPNMGGVVATLKALGAMDTLLRGEQLSGSSVGNAVVTRDAQDVDAWADQRPTSERYQAANAQVQANAQLEQEKLGNLAPEQRETYLRVKEQLMTIAPAGDPVAALSLQKLLFTGKLTEGPSLRDGKNVMDGLSQLSTGPLAEGMDRQQLLADLVQELATPSAINQGPVGTCAGTSVGIHLLRNNPAEYVRLVAGLASPAGEVATASGKMLRREPDALTDGISRSQVQRLLVPAFMEIAHPRRDYQSGPEEGQYKNGDNKGTGLNAKEVDRILEAVYDDRFKKKNVGGFPLMRPKKAMERIEEQLAKGKDVLAGLEWESGGHKVVVTGTETVNGQQYVNYINPWGREERMTRDEFMDRLNNFNYED